MKETTTRVSGSGQRLPRRAAAGAAGLLAACGALLISAQPALAAPVLQNTQTTVEVTPPSRAWLLILAILMVATAVQLLIEVVWNYLEWYLLNVRGWTPTHIKSPQFQQFKSGTSLLIGGVLGILFVNLTGMSLFSYFRPLVPNFVSSVPSAVDVLLTGLLIGAVTKPVHDVFALIGKTKDFMGASAIRQRELATDALASGVLKLAQSEAQALVDVPGIGPARLPVPSELGDSETGSGEGSPTERYVDLLHNRTMM